MARCKHEYVKTGTVTIAGRKYEVWECLYCPDSYQTLKN